MNKVKVTVRYLSERLGHSRYGYSRLVETAVRFCTEDDLDEVIDQFRNNHEVIEVKIFR